MFGQGMEALRGTVGELLAADLAAMTDGELADETLDLRRQLDLLELAFAERAHASHTRGVGAADGSPSTPAWLRRHTGLPEGRARAAIEDGDAADALPRTRDAWASGAISAHAARTIFTARVDGHDDELRACEEQLVELAQQRAPRHLWRAVRHFRDLATAGGDEHARHERRGLSISSTIDGLTILDATLDAEGGEVVLTAIHAYTDKPSTTDTRTAAQRRADALKRICEVALHVKNPTSIEVRSRPHVTYLVSHETLLGGQLGVCDGEFTGPIGRATMERILCDCDVSRVVTGPGGVILDAGSSRRTPSAAQRRAVVARDQGCVFPGCDRPPGWCEVHHRRHWIRDGPTDLENLVLLCDFHHHFAHTQGLILEWIEGRLEVFWPNGLALAA
jgi:hypothetical protein